MLAWALQERILSRRVLIFGGDRLYWDCQQSKGRGPISFRFPPQVSNKDWHFIVMEYSGRELTIESDKLPALAGLAELYRQATGDQYLAGLWRSSLIVDLLWKRQRVLSCHGVLTSMPMEYRAPSWSWAALDGNVSFALSGRRQRLSEAEILGAYLDTIEGLDPPPGQWLWIRGALFEAHVGEDDVRISGEKLGASWLDI
ncbi:hypothetical protein B0J14DRAFT_273063 [Halenospora varia]|nr:hypothetical protein B0J14DRAFT_273063 [Halenospora varia]